MIALDDFEALEETAHLLRSPRNARRLRHAVDPSSAALCARQKKRDGFSIARFGIISGLESAANHDLGLETGFPQCIDHHLHVGHRGGQQCGDTDHLCIVFLGNLDELLRRDIDTGVHNLEAGAFEHHADEVLADVMQVALDCADDGGGQRLHASRHEFGLQNFHAGLHGACGNQHFRNVDFVLLKLGTDDSHAL